MVRELMLLKSIEKIVLDRITSLEIILSFRLKWGQKKLRMNETVKLINKSLFGKICENQIKHIDAKILTDQFEILKLVCKPTLKDILRYSNWAPIVFYNREVKFDKPICLSFTVFELKIYICMKYSIIL